MADPVNPSHQLPLQLGGPRISRITIARLHNLGNYEHVRYEVTVELPLGTSPASVARELEETLAELEPKRPVSLYELGHAIKLLSKPAPKFSDFDDLPAGVAHVRFEEAQNERERAERLIKKHEEWKADHEAALARFDRLGGTRLFTDAKDNWDDDVPY